ncbi:MAG: hypothetical protein L0H84_02145 [Pseudonocardia sp.]|nr:hypothetical protein [Pseudonocardia sp.]
MPIGSSDGPDEFAAATALLCSQGSSFLIGATLTVDGGLLAGTARHGAEEYG